MMHTDEILSDGLGTQIASENQQIGKYNNLPQKHNFSLRKPYQKKCQNIWQTIVITIIFAIVVFIIVQLNIDQVRVGNIFLSCVIYLVYMTIGYLILVNCSYFINFQKGMFKDNIKQKYLATIQSPGHYKFEIFCYKQIYPNYSLKCDHYNQINIPASISIDLSDSIEDILNENRFLILQFTKQCSLSSKQSSQSVQRSYDKFFSVNKNFTNQIIKKYSEVDNFEQQSIFVSQDGQRSSRIFRMGFYLSLMCGLILPYMIILQTFYIKRYVVTIRKQMQFK